MINPAVADVPGSPAPAASSAQSTRAPSPEPRPLPYLFYHDIESALTTPPPLTNLRSLLRTFTPTLPPAAPYHPPTLASLFAALDQPYGFECVLRANHSRQHAYFIPFLSALFVYSQPTPSHPVPALLFSHTDSLPPHTRYPLPYQVHHLLQHQPAFAQLLHVPLAELGERSWLSLYWSPVLVDLRHEHMLAGYCLAYYQLDCRQASTAKAAAGGAVRPAGSGARERERERERLEARSRGAAGRGGATAEHGEDEADAEDEEPGRSEGESEGQGGESKESMQRHDVAALTRQLNGALHLHGAEYDGDGEDDGVGADDNAAEEGVPQPIEMNDVQLLLVGYVGCKVDESTWYGEGGQLEGDESAVTDTFTAYRLTSGGAESRVTHVDIENELYDLLNGDGLLHPDYLHAVQHTKTR